MSSPNDSPCSVHIQPLHNPQNAAQVSVPQAPLGNATNGPIVHGPGMGTKALLAKRMPQTKKAYTVHLMVSFTEAFEQKSYLCLANRQFVNPSDAEDQRRQEETLQQVSIFNAVSMLGLVDGLAFFRGKSVPIPALFGDANASDDEDGETIPSASSGTSGGLVATDDNPF